MANEKRLIDANALLAEYDRVHIGKPGKARKLIADATTVDAVEVVRCKDCKHFSNLPNDRGYCELEGQCKFPNPTWHINDFCSYGERKENELP